MNTQKYNQIMKAKDNQKVKMNHLNKSARLLSDLIEKGMIETAVFYAGQVNKVIKTNY